MYYGYGYGPMMDGGFGIFGVIWQIVWLVIVIAVVIFIVRAIFGGRGRHMRRWMMWEQHSALSILNERFAKGEIDEKEYEMRKKALLSEAETK